jgi:hypothetical protein
MAMRECPYCGKMVYDRLTQCNYCRERLPEITVRAASSPEAVGGSGEIRRGLLSMLLAGVIGYFASGSSALALPIPVPPPVMTYLSPLLFLGGLCLCLHGFFLRHRASV